MQLQNGVGTDGLVAASVLSAGLGSMCMLLMGTGGSSAVVIGLQAWAQGNDAGIESTGGLKRNWDYKWS